MLEKKVLDLLNQELDGVNSDKEHEAVRRILARKPEARKYLEDLQEMSLQFRRVKDVPPPPHLKARIINALPYSKRPVPARSSSVSSFLHELRYNLRYRYAYTFAGGAVAGILLFVMLTGQPTDSNNLTGTMAPNGHELIVESRTPIDLAEARGTIGLKQFESSLIAELDLQVPQEADIVLNFDPKQIQFDSFKPMTESQGTLVVLEGQLRLTVSGQQKYQFSFTGSADPTAPLSVRIFARGILLSEYSLSLNRQENQ